MDIILEGMLFIVGDEGLALTEIASLLEVDEEKAKTIVNDLINYYEKQDRALAIECLGEKYKFVTKDKHMNYYQKLVDIENNKDLSESLLEVLAIIAYNEPITRNDIEDIRGTDASYQIRRLLLKGLIDNSDKLDAPGRPSLYRITNKFLDYFNLKSKEELPNIKVEEAKQEELEIFNSIYKEE